MNQYTEEEGVNMMPIGDDQSTPSRKASKSRDRDLKDIVDSLDKFDEQIQKDMNQ